MSRENVEIVRALFEVWNAGDMDAFRELYDPDVILRTVEDWPEPGPYVGREAVMRFHEQLRETWDADALEPVSDFIDAADHVLVRYVWRGTGHGPEANMELTLVFTMRKGRVVYLEFFWDHAEALETLGLPEESMSQTNVELARSSIEAYIAGDRDAYINFFADDVEGCPDVSRFPEAEPFRGREELRRFIAGIDQGWEGGATAVLREVFPVGDRVVARADWGGRGRTSGIDLLSSLTSIYTFRDGRIVKVEWFFDHAKALEAVGLSE
jgi:ketosteroid isomerase-like protein